MSTRRQPPCLLVGVSRAAQHVEGGVESLHAALFRISGTPPRALGTRKKATHPTFNRKAAQSLISFLFILAPSFI